MTTGAHKESRKYNEKLIFNVDWIRMAQHRVQWWHLVNTVMNLQVP
jgi:hypothetical protein